MSNGTISNLDLKTQRCIVKKPIEDKKLLKILN